MSPNSAMQEELWTHLIDIFRKVEILNRDLANSVASPLCRGVRIGRPPAEALQLYLVGVLRILRFTFDSVEFQEDIRTHLTLLPVCVSLVTPEVLAAQRAARGAGAHADVTPFGRAAARQGL